VGRDGVGLGAGTVAPMQRSLVSKEQWLRCRGGGDHADVVQSRISKESRMPTTPKGAGWKTSMVPRVSMMSMVSPPPLHIHFQIRPYWDIRLLKEFLNNVSYI